MAEKTGINRQYKDRLFKFIFGNPEHKEWTLALYNAINGSFYDILPSIAKHNNFVLCRLRSSRQSHIVALAEGV